MKRWYNKLWLSALIFSMLLSSIDIALPAGALSAEAMSAESNGNSDLLRKELSDKLAAAHSLGAADTAPPPQQEQSSDKALEQAPLQAVNRSGEASSSIQSDLPAEEEALLQASSTTAPVPDYSYVETKPDQAPYAVSLDQETVSTLSGDLTVQAADFTLPGRNGLSFTLMRTYNSSSSQLYQMGKYAKEIGYGDTVSFTTPDDILFPIGKGWSWDLSYMSRSGTESFLHLAGKGTYKLKNQQLVGYPWKDINIQPDTRVRVGLLQSQFVVTSLSGIRQYFSDSGRLIQISNAYNNHIQFFYEYDSPAALRLRLTRIQDDAGNAIVLTYTKDQVVLSKDGQTIRYQLTEENGKQLLTSVTDPLGRVTTYDYHIKSAKFSLVKSSPEYDNPYALLTGIMHPTGAKTVYSYEEAPVTRYFKEAVNQVYRLNTRHDEVYLSDGTTVTAQPKTILYPSGDYASSFTGDYSFSVAIDDGLTQTVFTSKKDYIDYETPAVYYTTNTTRTSRDEAGATHTQSTDYTYDEVRRLPVPNSVKLTQRKEGLAQTFTLQNSQVYDDYGNVTQSIDPLGVTTLYGYDANHLLVSVSRPVAPGQTLYTRLTRDSVHPTTVIAEELFDGSPSGTKLAQTNYEQIDPITGNIGQIRTKNGGGTDTITHIQYADEYQQSFPTRTSTLVSDASGSSSYITREYVYDRGTGRLTRYIDGNGHPTSYQYDGLGRLMTVLYADGSSFSLRYNDKSNSIQSTDPAGVETYTQWDPLGRKIAEGISEEQLTVSYQYDAYSRLMGARDALGNTTRFGYDQWSRQHRIQYADGSATRIVYDDIDRVTTSIDPTGYTLKDYLDAAGRTVRKDEVKQSNGVTTTTTLAAFDYDFTGNLKQRTDSVNPAHPTTYRYDVLGRLTQVSHLVDAGQGQSETTSYQYSPLGGLTQITYPDGNRKLKKYDELGRLLQMTDAEGKQERFVYDANGNLTAWTDRNGTTVKQTFDSHNRLQSKIVLDAQGMPAPEASVSYAYDPAGKRLRMEDVTGTTAYTYDPSSGRLIGMTYPDGRTLQYHYDEAGNLKDYHAPFGSGVYFGYDSRNRLTSVGPSISDVDATYDYLGNNLLREIRQANGVTSTFDYDGLRLHALTETASDGTLLHSFAYTYDSNGNQRSRTEDGITSSFTYDALNRVVTSSQFGETYTYDNRGNRIKMTSESAFESLGTDYAYDPHNRLSSVTASGGSTVSYTYNGDGLLWERTEGGKTTRYYWSGDQVIAEADVAGGVATLKARYIRGNGLVAREDEQGKTYYLHNGHGDVVGLMDASGTTRLNAYSYDIWGNIASQRETMPQPFKYSGELWDNTTGLQYLRARWYDPSMGRFVNEDTYEGQIDNPLSLNLYTYVENNPLIYWDPSGHAACNSQSECQAQYQSLNQISASDGMDYMLNQYVFEQVQNNESLINDTKDEKLKDYYRSLNSWYRNNPCSYLAESCTGGTASFTGMEDGFYILSVESGGKTTTYGMNSEYGMTSCNCFTAGTTVLTENGEKPIEEVAIGDKVLAKDEVTGDIAYKEVEWLFQKEVDTLYHLTIDNEVISTTSEHPFWVVGKGWVKTQDLQIGDVLVDSDESEVSIEAIEVENKSAIVYNFMVKDYHTYYVSNLKIWTHNACTLASARKMAVRQAWAQEKALVEQTGKGTVEWSDSQKRELLSNGKVKGYYGHHINSVKGSPELAGVANNIEFVTFKEHLSRHFGNFRNVTVGALLNRKPPNK